MIARRKALELGRDIAVGGTLCTDFDCLCKQKDAGSCSKQEITYMGKFKDAPLADRLAWPLQKSKTLCPQPFQPWAKGGGGEGCSWGGGARG